MYAVGIRDSCNPEFWRGRWLRYSLHAENQAAARNIPLLRYLPVERARLVDCDLKWYGIKATTWKIVGLAEDGRDDQFLVIRANAEVATVFQIDAAWPQICRRKQLRRELCDRASYQFVEDIMNCEEAQTASVLVDFARESFDDFQKRYAAKETGRKRNRAAHHRRSQKRVWQQKRI